MWPLTFHQRGLAEIIAFYEYMNSQWAQERLLPLDVVRSVRAGRR